MVDIVLDYQLKDRPDDLTDERLSTTRHWHEVCELVMRGDLIFTVDGMDFGATDTSIIFATDMLLTATDALLFYTDYFSAGYEDEPDSIIFQRQAEVFRLSQTRSWGGGTTTDIDLLKFCTQLGDFSLRMLWQLLDDYPAMKKQLHLFTGPTGAHFNLQRYLFSIRD